ncbi:MAG: 50S ribosomal protein L22 [candidate division Zixibacteria bacterium]|nr:50S ribosomal protein L22 [candidate division Zixibacteria bacterium]
MQATARLKFLMMSPRKVRRVITLVKGKSVEEALSILKFTNKAAALPLAKTIKSATANALSIEGTSRIKAEDLAIASIFVDEGPRAKRIQFRAMGRAYRYKKRFAHLTVVVEGEPKAEEPTKKMSKKAAAEEETKAVEQKTTKKAGKAKAEKEKAKPKVKAKAKAKPKAAVVKKVVEKKTTTKDDAKTLAKEEEK